MKLILSGGLIVERPDKGKPKAEAKPAPAKRGRKPKAQPADPAIEPVIDPQPPAPSATTES